MRCLATGNTVGPCLRPPDFSMCQFLNAVSVVLIVAVAAPLTTPQMYSPSMSGCVSASGSVGRMRSMGSISPVVSYATRCTT